MNSVSIFNFLYVYAIVCSLSYLKKLTFDGSNCAQYNYAHHAYNCVDFFTSIITPTYLCVVVYKYYWEKIKLVYLITLMPDLMSIPCT